MGQPKRMFYNDDGDSCLGCYRGPIRPEMVTDAVDTLLGTPITTLVLCVASSDLVTYPSQVASMYCWRKTPSDRTSPIFRQMHHFYQRVREEGWDIPAMVMARAAEKGMEFIPSMRMNDGHFASKVDPQEHPFTSEFYLDHQDLIMQPGKPWAREQPFTDYLLDFQYEPVRAHRRATAFEVIDRYGDAGFEMDWTRHYHYFRPGETQPELLTDMVRQVRGHLDARGPAPVGERRPLVMRVAGTMELCQSYGQDIATWVDEGLIDYVVPSSPDRYITFDMPIERWLDVVTGTPVEVHPSADSACWCGDGQATLEMYRAAAANFYDLGAHGFYVFNLFCRGYPLGDDAYSILRDVCDPDALTRRDKCFMPNRTPFESAEDRCLPIELADGDTPARITIPVGDDLDRSLHDSTLRSAILRLRFDGQQASDGVRIALNGTWLGDAPVQHLATTARNGSIATNLRNDRAYLRDPHHELQIDLAAAGTLPVRGRNVLHVLPLHQPADDRAFSLRLADAQIEVAYDYCGKQEIAM